MAEASSNIKDALSKALNNAAIQLSQQEQFSVTVKGVQRRVLQDLDSFNAKLMDSMETSTQLMLGKWKSETKDVGLVNSTSCEM